MSGEELCMRNPFGNRGCARRVLCRVDVEISCWIGDFETIDTLWEMDTRGSASAPSLHPSQGILSPRAPFRRSEKNA